MVKVKVENLNKEMVLVLQFEGCCSRSFHMEAFHCFLWNWASQCMDVGWVDMIFEYQTHPVCFEGSWIVFVCWSPDSGLLQSEELVNWWLIIWRFCKNGGVRKWCMHLVKRTQLHNAFSHCYYHYTLPKWIFIIVINHELFVLWEFVNGFLPTWMPELNWDSHAFGCC